jgi:hypothetical protein
VTLEQSRRRRRPRTARWLLLAVAAGIVLFGVGVALGEALHDNPRPGGTRTFVRTLHPLSIPPAVETKTVTVTATS